jgi:simple sugar transport system substrate-binding protein
MQSLKKLILLALTVLSCYYVTIASAQCACLSRPTTRVRVISHGSQIGDADNAFWHAASEGARQAAEGMHVQLEWQTPTQSSLNVDQMIALLDGAVADNVEAVVLALASDREDFLDAARRVSDAGIPLFAFAAGASVAESVGARAFFGQRDDDAGYLAGARLRDAGGRHALCVDPSGGSLSTRERCDGLARALEEVGGSSTTLRVDANNVQLAFEAIVDAVAASPNAFDVFVAADELAVRAVFRTLSSLDDKSSLVASFNTNDEVLSRLADGDMLFAVSQQQYSMAHLAVTSASLYATTLNAPANAIVATGPRFLTQADAGDIEHVCALAGHPICEVPGTVVETRGCPCTDLSELVVEVHSHAIVSNAFWRPVEAGALKAGSDAGIEIRWVPNGQTIDLDAMAQRIANIASDPTVKGIACTIPDPSLLVPAILSAAESMPVTTLNSGADIIGDLALASNGAVIGHAGQPEFEAGQAAGVEFARLDFSKALCLNFEPTNQALNDRCNGALDAIQSSGGVGLTQVEVPIANAEETRQIAAAAFAADAELDSALGSSTTPAEAVVSLKVGGTLPDIGIGAFDLSQQTLDFLEADSMQFSIHQLPYSQGYFSVSLLFLKLHTRGQQLVDPLVKTGPALVRKADAPAWRCESELYPECIVETTFEVDRNNGERYAMIAIACVLIACVLAIMIYVVIYRSVSVWRYASPTFLFAILIGAIFTFIAVILLALDANTSTCTAAAWFGFFGFALMLACLFAKHVRALRIIRGAEKLRSVRIREIDMIPFVAIISGVVVAVLIAWSALDAPSDYRLTDGLGEDEYMIMCNSPSDGVAFVATMIAIFGCLLLLGCVLAFMTRKVPSAFNESKYIALATYNSAIMLIIAIVVLFALDDLNTTYLIVSIVILLASAVFVALIFAPKIYMCALGRGNEVSYSSRGATVTDGGSTRLATTMSSGTTTSSMRGPVKYELNLASHSKTGTETFDLGGEATVKIKFT